jgi:hypothetical protein
MFDPESFPLDQSTPSRPTPSEETGRRMELKQLQREVERLRLVVEVIIRALVEKGLYTREQLNAMANLIDVEDGRRDAGLRMSKEIHKCSSCGRTMMDTSGSCLYCGHQEVMSIL